jgi:hypothetical protein
MLPNQLQTSSFLGYPPKARKLASDHVDLLRQLPLGFVPFLLNEIISYDWKFPVEQREIEDQLKYLSALPAENRSQEMASFAGLRLNPKLEKSDWINDPAAFVEQFSAHLWESGQMDTFRAASQNYVHRFHTSLETPRLPAARIGIVLIGRGIVENRYRLFRKLRRHGVYLPNVKPQGGWEAVLEFVHNRAKAHPAPYAHWYIDGGAAADVSSDGLTSISYQAVSNARAVLAAKMRQSYESPAFGAEALQSELARLRPEDLEMPESGADPVLSRFQASLLTQGSGTQIYSTTFVQWAAREIYRRAQPITLLARFQPRVRERPMNELLDRIQQNTDTDPQGSLIDADMGAYYTWLNQQRLAGADQSAFLVWFEEHTEAVVVGPALPRATVDPAEIDMAGLLRKIA